MPKKFLLTDFHSYKHSGSLNPTQRIFPGKMTYMHAHYLGGRMQQASSSALCPFGDRSCRSQTLLHERVDPPLLKKTQSTDEGHEPCSKSSLSLRTHHSHGLPSGPAAPESSFLCASSCAVLAASAPRSRSPHTASMTLDNSR